MEQFNPNAKPAGLLAAVAVVEPFERREDFEKVWRGFRRALRPVGRGEEVLGEKAAVGYWRMRRTMLAEAEEVVHRLFAVPPRNLIDAIDPVTLEIPEENKTVDRLWPHGPSGKVSWLSLPAPDVMGALTAMWHSTELEFHRALRTLERMQAFRLGQLVDTSSATCEPF